MSDQQAPEQGQDVQVIDTSAEAARLVAEGSLALSAATLDVMKQHVESSVNELKALDAANQIVATHYNEMKENVADIDEFYEEYNAQLAALKPQFDQIDQLEAVVVALEAQAANIEAQTSLLENAITEVLGPSQ